MIIPDMCILYIYVYIICLSCFTICIVYSFFLMCFFQYTGSYFSISILFIYIYIYNIYIYMCVCVICHVSKLVEAGRTHGPFFFLRAGLLIRPTRAEQ